VELFLIFFGMSNIFKFAENILNNLDQSTQTALQKSNQTNNNTKSSPFTSNSYQSASLSRLTQDTPNNHIKPSPSSSSFKSINKKYKDKDEELMDFLNSSNSLTSENKVKAKQMTLVTDSSRSVSKNGSDNDSEDAKSIIMNNEKPESEDELKADDRNEEESNEQQQQQKPNEEIEKKIIYENKRLKNEVVSLSDEIKSLTNKIKGTEEEFQRSKRKIDHFQSQISESDKIIRELRSREEDLNESIKSKDSQLAVLRIRFEQVDEQLKRTLNELNKIKNESERILKDHSNSSEVQSQALETLRSKLAEVEMSLEYEKKNFGQAQREHMAIQSKLEEEKQNLSENLQIVEKKLSEEKCNLFAFNVILDKI
jgi:chromosome segregation ATPase